MTPSTDDKIDIITSISEGSRSAVYLATDSTDNFVVYKKIKGENRILLYKRIADSGLEFFPKIFKMDYSDGVNYVIEEYIEGKDLRKLLKEGIDYDKAVELTEQLMEAVNCLHKLDPPLLHRDIKPENIIVSPDGKLRLIDFDAAREYDDDEKEHDTVMLGTRGYAAPEQFGFNQTDVRSDIYSVGIVCNQIFENIDVSANKKAKILKCFSKATMFDPNERYHNMEEMLQAFKKARSKTINKNIFIIGSICACLIIIVIVWALNSKNDLPGTTDGIEQKALTVVNNEKNDNSGIVSHEEKNKTEKEVENITNSPEKEEESSVPEVNDGDKNAIDDPQKSDMNTDYTSMDELGDYYKENSINLFYREGNHLVYKGIREINTKIKELKLSSKKNGIPVTVIDNYALAGKDFITDIYIPSSYTEIREGAFHETNTDLKFHVISGSYAEKYCKANGLNYEIWTDAGEEDITPPEENNEVGLQDETDQDNGIYIYRDKDGKQHFLSLRDGYWEYWGIPDGEEYNSDLVLPEQENGIPVAVIGEWALAGKTGISVLTIPASYTGIEESAFYDMSPDVIFRVYSGSFAEYYCKEKKLRYEVIK